MKNILIPILLLILSFPQLGCAQSAVNETFSFEVNRVFVPLSISRAQLDEARTIEDLNKHYKPEWVKTFESVEILTSHNGKVKKAVSKNDQLSNEQISNLKTADLGSDISVKVFYIPDNTLPHNDVKLYDFSFIVNPENEATFVGGLEKLNEYLQANAIDKVSVNSFEGYDLAAIQFTITETGEVVDVRVPEGVYQTSINDEIIGQLQKAISEMPNWKPASYANGTTAKQDVVFSVGNHLNCWINVLNIRRPLPEID